MKTDFLTIETLPSGQLKSSRGLLSYDPQVIKGGKVISEYGNYRDWYLHDDEAQAGLRAVMEEQGFKVERVEIHAGGKATIFLS